MALASTTISGSRWKAAGFTLGCLGLLALGLILVLGPSSRDRDVMIGWLIMPLSAVFAFDWAWAWARPQTMTLDAQGFTMSGGLLRKARSVAWRDIEGFFALRLTRGVAIAVAYNLAPHAAKTSTVGKLSRTLGADDVLPSGWPVSVEKMVERLNAYRTATLGGSGEPTFQR